MGRHGCSEMEWGFKVLVGLRIREVLEFGFGIVWVRVSEFCEFCEFCTLRGPW